MMAWGANEPDELMQAFTEHLNRQAQCLLDRQPKLLETLEAYYRLERLARRDAKAANRQLHQRAKQVELYWQKALGSGGGRPRKDPSMSVRYNLGCRVAAALPEFDRWMKQKKLLEAKTRNREVLKSRLRAQGCPDDILHFVWSCPTGLAAACKYVAETGTTHRDSKSIARYWREFRDYYDWVPSRDEIDRLPRI